MRVLIAEDDKISARVLSAAVTGLGYEVVLAKDGREALDFLLRKQVQTFDVLITDWVMPRMDGIDLIREATQAGVRPALVIMSTGERIQSAAQRLALDVGVDDFITKPLQIAQIRRCLTKGLEALGLSHPPPRPAPGPAPKPAPRPAPKPAPMVPPHIPRLLPMRGPTLVRSAHQATKTSARPRKLCVIAASTGGPPVVHALFSEKRLPHDVSYLVLIHAPEWALQLTASGLAEHSGMTAAVAQDGEALRPGHIHVAPGGRHMELDDDGQSLRLHDGPPVNFVRPAADLLFLSAADAWNGRGMGSKVVAAVLTGLGADGALGAEQVHRTGGRVLVQDPADCVAPFMPRAVLNRGIPAKSAKRDQLVSALIALLS